MILIKNIFANLKNINKKEKNKIIKKNEKIAIGWCDNGTTDGFFTEGLLRIALDSSNFNWSISETIRVQGNQVAVQRQRLIDYWYNNFKSDWILCVDSDIVLTTNIVKKIFDVADKNTHKIVTGVYFIAKEYDGSLPAIFPCIFNDINDKTIKYYNSLPKDQIIKIDCAGMGLVVIHRSVIKKLKDIYGETSLLFKEISEEGNLIGEDISFFRKCKKANIDLYAHTGAIAQHIKRVAWDLDYYNLFWEKKQKKEEIKNTPPN